MDFIGKIKDGIFILSSEQAGQRKALLASKEGKIIKETIVEFRQNKSDKQLNAWWGVFASTVKEEFDDRGWDSSYLFNLASPTGIEISRELLKEYMYAVCPVYDGDKRVTISKMNTAQMAQFFSMCQAWAATQWHIIVPDPQRKDDNGFYGRSGSAMERSGEGTSPKSFSRDPEYGCSNGSNENT